MGVVLDPGGDLRVAGSGGGGPSGPLAVSSDGKTLVASAPYYNEYAPTAFVFHASSESAWATTSTPTAALTPPDHGDGGYAVAISGDGTTVLLSDNVDYFDGGRAYLYHVAAEDGWVSKSTPTAILSDASSGTGMDSSDSLGYSLALSGDGTVALLGAEPYTSKPDYVDVFHVSGAANWVTTATPTATLTRSGGAKHDYFGDSLTMSGDGTTAVVTAPWAGSGRGAAYVFHVTGGAAWATSSTPTATLTDSAGHANDVLGFTAALSADGATVLLGAPGFDWDTGKADVFYVADASSWNGSSTPAARLTDSALPKPVCVVPRLVGKSLSQAKDTLRYTNCLLGKVKKVHSTKKNKRRVVWQSRAPKRHLSPGRRSASRSGSSQWPVRTTREEIDEAAVFHSKRNRGRNDGGLPAGFWTRLVRGRTQCAGDTGGSDGGDPRAARRRADQVGFRRERPPAVWCLRGLVCRRDDRARRRVRSRQREGAAYIYHASGADSWATTSTPAATLTPNPAPRINGSESASPYPRTGPPPSSALRSTHYRWSGGIPRFGRGRLGVDLDSDGHAHRQWR